MYVYDVIALMQLKIIFFIYLGADEDAWTDNEVVVNFLAHDEESGIEYCEWAVGSSPYKTISLIKFKQHHQRWLHG